VRSIHVEHNATFNRPQFDMVVVDAPCSGMGTVRRLPMVKWRLQPDVAARHGAKQLDILSSYSNAVRPGGVLVYATCSILPVENEHVVAAFLAAHPEFAADDLTPIMQRMDVQIQPTGHTLQCDPLHHSTDGLFVARMRRSA
jgi:16S rRNA (cytosine967-C5)-methyltransferase